MTSDEIRQKIVALFEEFKPSLDKYYDYGQRVTALSEEYHKARFAEGLSMVPHEESHLFATLDARETPASLDRFLANMEKDKIKRIVFDRAAGKYYIFI